MIRIKLDHKENRALKLYDSLIQCYNNNDIEFTMSDEDADFIIVLDKNKTGKILYPSKTIFIEIEHLSWRQVFGMCDKYIDSCRFIWRQSELGNIPYSFVSSEAIMAATNYNKSKILSAIDTNKNSLPGQSYRRELNALLQEQCGRIFDYYGKAAGQKRTKFKDHCLLDYKYHIAVENSINNGYYTEKIVDPLLCLTLPFYYGCFDLEKYIPAESFIRIPGNKEEAKLIILEAIESNQYEKRLPAIKEARTIFLTDRHPCTLFKRATEFNNLA